MSSCMFKKVINKMFTNDMYLTYMYKQDLTFNILQWLQHKTKPNLQTIHLKIIFITI